MCPLLNRVPAVSSWNQLRDACDCTIRNDRDNNNTGIKESTVYDSCRGLIALKSSNPINHDRPKSCRNEEPSRGDDTYLSTHLDHTSNRGALQYRIYVNFNYHFTRGLGVTSKTFGTQICLTNPDERFVRFLMLAKQSIVRHAQFFYDVDWETQI